LGCFLSAASVTARILSEPIPLKKGRARRTVTFPGDARRSCPIPDRLRAGRRHDILIAACDPANATA